MHLADLEGDGEWISGTIMSQGVACTTQAPTRANTAVGVKVEPGKGCLYVKVHWADRRGLLADIIAALKSMPLEV